jgi:hypothetical protein
MILHPMICTVAEGLFSCYHYSPGKLMMNMMLHGKFDIGKTHAGMTMLFEYTTIPGTCVEYTNATPAADTTLKHNYDLIVAMDETPQYMVSSAEAKRFANLVNKEKVKFTKGQLGSEVFGYETGPDGEKHRWKKTITTDHHMTRMMATNFEVEGTTPLASRMYRTTVTLPKVPARKMQEKAGSAITEQQRMYLQVNQYLTAWICKAEMCGVILPDVELKLFWDVSNRAMDYLIDAGLISKSVGSRGLEIMKPYVRQLVYSMAIQCAMDMPNSPCYKKKFKVSMIKHIEPYLYVTTEQIWWGWTAMAGCWFDENISNVCEAMRKAAGIREWQDGMTSYDLYERDVGSGQIKWRMIEGIDTKAGDYEKGDKLIDITYLRLDGNFMSICASVASFTKPTLAVVDVQGIFNLIKNMQVLVKSGYVPQPQSRFASWHKYLDLPNSATGDPGRKRVTSEAGTMPPDYMHRTVDTTVARSEIDVPKYTTERSCAAMEIHQDHICFMPGIDAAFKSSKIVEALEYATLCKTTRPGKVLLGFTEENDSTQLQIFNMPETLIEKHIATYDRLEGWEIHPESGENIWIGDPNLAERERPVSRREGICFDRRGGLAKADAVFFNFVSAAPVPLGDTSWRDAVNADIERMKHSDIVVHDLNFESAKRQHIACGRPLDAPILCPKYIEEAYKAECLRRNIPWHANLDYPHQILAEIDQREADLEHRVSTTSALTVGVDLYREGRLASNFARDPVLRNQIMHSKEKQKGTKRARETTLSSSNTNLEYIELYAGDDTMQPKDQDE